ncbi:MAG: tRNA preQ1(34) S-adenosylmethionine ribosyltransferase-isomerase QueA [Verrucomicrobia bacterium]|nr:tRNA preQ1(34) S-adenosylmethionine ribosyltransferase-isomerase QueA [Verrucomicrobiota bacterium]
MKLELFDYHLPAEAIAQTPAAKRDESRLLLVDRAKGTHSHHTFRDLPDLLPSKVTFFRNAVSVIKARLFGTRANGGKVECLLLHPGTEHNQWWCMVKPGKRLPEGTSFELYGYRATVVSRNANGDALVYFELPDTMSVMDLSVQHGIMPLPPYISRKPGDERTVMDAERYQTVYANPEENKAVAAPTAGLHFTPELLGTMERQGHVFHDLYLHVGSATFRPIKAAHIEDHAMHSESYILPHNALSALHASSTRPHFAVGTTAMRSIEDYCRKHSVASSAPGSDYMDEANLFIYPPSGFHLNGLITNFHLPRSTLLCLVSAFLTPGSTDGIAWLKDLYREALAKNYRFYSYGDAMLIL